MMQVDVTCRYCQRKLHNPELLVDPGDKDMDEEWIFECKACNSRQCFTAKGQPTFWQFTINQYSLCFNPATQIFQIHRLPLRMLPNNNHQREALMQLDYLPHNLTPTTCTEERVKTFILFS